MTANKMNKIFKSQGGCKEDCFNCPFPDCYKPAQEMEKDEVLLQSRSLLGLKGKRSDTK